MSVAGVAHPVERHLAKVEVASSSLVTRSIKKKDHTKVWSFFFMEMDGDRPEPSESNSPVDCWALPVSTAMLPYEVSKGHRGIEPRHPLL